MSAILLTLILAIPAQEDPALSEFKDLFAKARKALEAGKTDEARALTKKLLVLIRQGIEDLDDAEGLKNPDERARALGRVNEMAKLAAGKLLDPGMWQSKPGRRLIARMLELRIMVPEDLAKAQRHVDAWLAGRN